MLSHRSLILSYLSLKPTSQQRKIDRRIAARRVLHQIRQISGGRPNKHSWSAHPLLIRRRRSHFNSQLNFAGWSADVMKIHSLVGRLPAACRSLHGGPWATVRNFCSAGQTYTARRTPVGDRWIICRFSFPKWWLLCDRWTVERWPCNHPSTIHGVSLGCAVHV